MKCSLIILEKIDKAKKNYEFTELYSHIIVKVTRIEEIANFLFGERNAQLLETFLHLFLINNTI